MLDSVDQSPCPTCFHTAWRLRLDFARARARYSYVICVLRAQFKIAAGSNSVAEGATSSEIQTATFTAAAKSSVVEVPCDNAVLIAGSVVEGATSSEIHIYGCSKELGGGRSAVWQRPTFVSITVADYIA